MSRVYVIGGKCPGVKSPGGISPLGKFPDVHILGGYVLKPA